MPNRAKLLNPGADEWVTAGPVILLENLAAKAGADWQRIIAKSHLNACMLLSPDNRIPIQPTLALFEDFGASCNDHDALFDGFHRLPRGDAGSFDYMALFAPSIRQALKNWSIFYPLRSNCIGLTYQETAQDGILTWDLPDRFGPRTIYSMAFMAYLVGRLERMLEQDTALPLRIEFASLPLKTMPEFLKPYAQRVRFNCQTTRLLISASLLDRKPSGSEANLYVIVEGAARRALAEATSQPSAISSITAAISAEMQKGDCSVRAIAQALGMSERSLQRTLESEGTTFRKLLDDVRKRRAQTYLMETDWPVGEISQHLGFSDISAFSRAVKQWYGVSPRGLRMEGSAPQAVSEKNARLR